MDTPMQKLIVSIPEAAKVLSLSRSTIYELMDAGELTKVKFGRRTCITVDSIKAAVKARIGEDLKDEVFAV
jgi:excisionase family DNA binding protein